MTGAQSKEAAIKSAVQVGRRIYALLFQENQRSRITFGRLQAAHTLRQLSLASVNFASIQVIRVNRNNNYNNNYNRNTNVNNNVNVNRNVNVNTNVDYHGGGYYGGGGCWNCGGCCYHPVATAAAVTATAVATAAIVGSVVNTIPPSCSSVIVGRVAYQQCGSTWYQPQFAGGATTYVVVNAPR